MLITRHNGVGFVLLLAAALLGSLPAQAAEGEAGHMHGPDGRHLDITGDRGGGPGRSILSHHDLKITDPRQPGPEGHGTVVEGCDVHSVVTRKGDPGKAVHREHNAFEPENGVYGSHMMYREPGEYVITETITMPDRSVYTLQFPIWVPDPHAPALAARQGPALLRYGVGGLIGLLVCLGAFWLGRLSGRRAVASLTGAALIASLWAAPGARAEEEAGHLHGPDGRHLAVTDQFGAVPEPLRAYPTPDGQPTAVQTQDPYRFELSIENEELAPSDPGLVSLAPDMARNIGLAVAVVKESRTGGGLVATGQVTPNPNQSVTVHARVRGRVVRVGTMPGDRIAAGHPLAVVDSPEVAEAQAAWMSAQSELRQAQAVSSRARAMTAEAQAGLERAQADEANTRLRVPTLRKVLTRQQDLAAAGAFAQGPVETARAARSAAEGELRMAQAALTPLEAQAQRLEAGVREGLVARKELEAAQSAVLQGQARVATAEQHLEIARAGLEREERIQRQGLRNAREVQQAEADLDAARLTLRAAQAASDSQRRLVQAARSSQAESAAAVARAQGAVRAGVARLRLMGATPGQGSQVTLRAPIRGAVVTRSVTAGEVVAAGQAVCTLLNSQTVWVESEVFERDLSRIRVGQRVTIVADAMPGRAVEGVVQAIAAQVNPDTRTVRLRTAVPNADGRLKPHMFVRVAIGVGSGRSLLVPTEALQEDEGEQIVFVREAAGTYRRRAVQTGATLGDQVIVAMGLKPGETVVTRGAYQLLALSRKG